MVLAVALVLPTAVTWLYFIALDGAAAAIQQTAYTLGKGTQFALPAVWVLLVQRQRPRCAPPRGWDLAAAIAFGLAAGGLIAAAYFTVLKPAGAFASAAEAVQEKVASFGVESLAGFVALAAFYSLVHSALEEYYWRWFVFGQLDRWLRPAPAIAVASLAFTAHHVLVVGYYFGWTSPFTWIASLGVAIGGAFWCWLYRTSGSLASPWLSHALVDAAIFLVAYDLFRG